MSKLPRLYELVGFLPYDLLGIPVHDGILNSPPVTGPVEQKGPEKYSPFYHLFPQITFPQPPDT
jgi:hypothetical protein